MHKNNQSDKTRTLPRMTSARTYEQVLSIREMGRMVKDLHESLEGAFLREQITEIVEDLYDIGMLTDVYEIFGGYNNRSFGIHTCKEGCDDLYFMRKYKYGITSEEICFEHSLINHAIQNGLTIVARTIVNKFGEPYVEPANSISMFAIYEYLPGEDEYTWDNPEELTDTEIRNGARVLADFHNAVRDFDPGKLQRREPPILDLWPLFAGNLTQLAKTDRVGKLLPYLREHLKEIVDMIVRNPFDPANVGRMPLMPTHYDFHPGNLKWSDEKVVGIFDFDWSKMDLRLFDVCTAIIHFCSHWKDHRDGELGLEKFLIFLRCYQQRLQKLDDLEAITDVEREMMPKMLMVANIYLLHWGVAGYLDREGTNDYEYLAYLKHSTRLMGWIECYKDDIVDTIKEALK